MKKTLKLFALMMAACATMFVACGEKDNDNDNGGGNGGGGDQPQTTSWSATFDGQPLNVAGYGDFQTDGEYIFLAQMAKRADGNSVYFPYITMWMQASDAEDVEVIPEYGGVELYKDTYHTVGTSQYGDWQYYSTEDISCSAFDMTTFTASLTGTFTMYYLTEIVNETHDDPADCTKKQLTITLNNVQFVVYE